MRGVLAGRARRGLDFRFHAPSIGGLLFRQQRPELFDQFAADPLPQFSILSLSDPGYLQLGGGHTRHGLDFDDTYQLLVARENKLAIATQAKDFQRVRNLVDVRLL